MYHVIEEASEALLCCTNDKSEAISEATKLSGKNLVLDSDDNIIFDSQPGISYKI
jgi:hypothetical protein